MIDIRFGVELGPSQGNGVQPVVMHTVWNAGFLESVIQKSGVKSHIVPNHNRVLDLFGQYLKRLGQSLAPLPKRRVVVVYLESHRVGVFYPLRRHFGFKFINNLEVMGSDNTADFYYLVLGLAFNQGSHDYYFFLGFAQGDYLFPKRRYFLFIIFRERPENFLFRIQSEEKISVREKIALFGRRNLEKTFLVKII